MRQAQKRGWQYANLSDLNGVFKWIHNANDWNWSGLSKLNLEFMSAPGQRKKKQTIRNNWFDFSKISEKQVNRLEYYGNDRSDHAEFCRY